MPPCIASACRLRANMPRCPRSAADEKDDEGEGHDPIDLEKGFTFAENGDADETWHTVVRKIERELRRQGFFGRTVVVKGRKVC